MRKNFDLRVWKRPTQKKLIMGITIAIFIIEVYVSNVLAAPTYSNELNLTPENESQQISVTGTVTDASSRDPMPGVNVQLKGTTIGAITDTQGRYSITVTDRNATLIFSFIGYVTQEIPMQGRSNVNISMESEVTGLEEVVVIGYGTQKKVNLTGAVSVATSETLENRPVPSVGHGLQGVIPNLNIFIRNGDPNTAADYNIRGYESINGGSPLILVDGIPMSLERINPNDIESVSVLKDASASAVYGARAAFGVILVETKKGNKDKINVTLNVEQSLAKPIWLVDLVTDPYLWATTYNKMNLRTNGQPAYDEAYMAGFQKWSENPTKENEWEVVNGTLRYYGNNKYQDRLIAKASPQQNYDFSINGATDKTTYYVSLGYLKKDGYINDKESNEVFQRYNILMKAEFKANDWLSFDEKIAFTSQINDKPHFYNWDVNINSSVRVSPMAAIQFPDLDYYLTPGDHDIYAQYIGMHFGGTNWFPYLENGGRTTYNLDDTWFTQGITISPIKGLRIRGDFSYNSYHRNYQDVSSKIEVIQSSNLSTVPFLGNGFSGDDYIINENNRNQYFVLNSYAEYTLDKFDNHYIKAMVGFNQEWGLNQWITASAKQLITPEITDLNSTIGTQTVDGSKSHLALRGAFYRLNYIYKDKYLIETNGRYDGTSRFPKESRFGFFPSVSIGWRVSNESFMAGTAGWMDNLKLRASYGQLGNQAVGSYYPYIASMGTGLSPFQMVSGQIPYVSAAGLVSPTLTWEKVVSQNIGLDVTLFKGKLDISADAYIRDTKDMLMDVEYPDVLGTSAPSSNAADLRTKGWEISVNWRNTIGQNWNYGLTVNISDNHAEITEYENPTGSLSEYYVGMKLGEIWGYVTEGIFQSQEEITAHANQSQLGANWQVGDIKYTDLNNDKIINAGSQTLDNPGDRRIIGNTTARYSFGIIPNLSYKNWTLNIFFQGLFRDYLPAASNWNCFYPGITGFIEKYYITESWTEDNSDAYFPALHISANNTKNFAPQSRYVQNAAYIRLKNLTLNYNLPEQWLSKIRIDQAQVYFTGMNLWEYTKMHKPLDPENITTVTQEYWMQRIFSLGVKVSF
jgi:TonB-linked SusC/RagA family outer membrane protein